VPEKLRELIADLERGGFRNGGSKRRHRSFIHPRGLRVTLSVHDRTAGAKIENLQPAIDRHVVILMETVTISPKFQIVIPQKIREAMGLRSGEKARMLSFRNRIEVIPIRNVRALRGYLKGIDTSFVRDGDRA